MLAGDDELHDVVIFVGNRGLVARFPCGRLFGLVGRRLQNYLLQFVLTFFSIKSLVGSKRSGLGGVSAKSCCADLNPNKPRGGPSIRHGVPLLVHH